MGSGAEWFSFGRMRVRLGKLFQLCPSISVRAGRRWSARHFYGSRAGFRVALRPEKPIWTLGKWSGSDFYSFYTFSFTSSLCAFNCILRCRVWKLREGRVGPYRESSTFNQNLNWINQPQQSHINSLWPNNTCRYATSRLQIANTERVRIVKHEGRG